MDRSRHDADFTFTWRDDPWAVRSNESGRASGEILMNLDHVEGWNSLGEADNQLDPGVSSFQNGVGRERRRDKNHCRVAASLLSCFSDGVEHGQAFMRGSAFAGRDTAHHIGP